jgi:MarR family transcriptional regulator, transcriptional regulator for hemolysin
MKIIGPSEHMSPRHKALAKYVTKARRFPRIRSFFWLLRCADALNKYASMEVGGDGDSRTELAMLQVLLKYPDGISQQAIANETGRAKQMIVVATDNLEKKGYAIRSSNTDDRRIKSILITKEGIDHLSEVFPHTVKMCDEALTSLSDLEVEQLLSLIMKLTKNIWQKIEKQSPKSNRLYSNSDET